MLSHGNILQLQEMAVERSRGKQTLLHWETLWLIPLEAKEERNPACTW